MSNEIDDFEIIPNDDPDLLKIEKIMEEIKKMEEDES